MGAKKAYGFSTKPVELSINQAPGLFIGLFPLVDKAEMAGLRARAKALSCLIIKQIVCRTELRKFMKLW